MLSAVSEQIFRDIAVDVMMQGGPADDVQRMEITHAVHVATGVE